MWELIAMAAGIGFGLMGLAAYIKTNLEGRKQEKELQNKRTYERTNYRSKDPNQERERSY